VSYIGVQPTAGQYRKLDDISASFNGSTTSFTTSVGGTNVTAGTAPQLLVSVGGVIQKPDSDYTVSTNTITFTTAPATGLDFFAVLMGDALNTVTTSDGSITTAKLAGSLSVGLAAGTNSAPSLYFTGDSNTGVYSPGADQVAVTTGGTQRLSIDSSGNVNIDSNTLYVDAANNRVGLGTSSPGNRIQINDSIATTYSASNTLNGGVIGYVKNASTTNSTDATIRLEATGSSQVAAASISSVHTGDGISALTFGTRNTGDVTERLRITGAGNVGIGTTSPVGKINSVISQADTASSSDTTLASSFLHLGGGEYGNGRYFLTTYGYSTNRTNSGAYVGALGTDSTGYGKYALVFGTRDVTTDTAPMERMRISSSGVVTAYYGLSLTRGPSVGLIMPDWRTYNSSSNQYVIDNYSVGVKLDNGATSWSTVSDERQKTNLVSIEQGLTKVSTLRAVTGRYLTDEEDVSRSFLIAQDVQAVLPEAVSQESDENDTLSLRYTEVIPLLVAALKESKERIETLEAKVAALEGA
jgi:Chaperone of endosialidase